MYDELLVLGFSNVQFLSLRNIFFSSTQIKGGGYPSFGDFDRDLKLMWKNCRTYNLKARMDYILPSRSLTCSTRFGIFSRRVISVFSW